MKAILAERKLHGLAECMGAVSVVASLIAPHSVKADQTMLRLHVYSCCTCRGYSGCMVASYFVMPPYVMFYELEVL